MQLSTLSLFFSVISAYLVLSSSWLWTVALFIALLLDALDGGLAVFQKSVSGRGEFLDWFMDRVGTVWVICSVCLAYRLPFLLAGFLVLFHLLSSALGKILLMRGVRKSSAWGFRTLLICCAIAGIIPAYLVLSLMAFVFVTLKLSIQLARTYFARK
ncbi:Uncharacterised protein [uncultured archaeon]|nr:Uncharacterised protein [uncultured archaeon]